MPEIETVLEKSSLIRPPTRRSSWYERFFELLSSRKIELVDADFVKVNITPDKSDASRFIRGLRFLGLIDENGKATRQMEKLRLTGEQFAQTLEEILRASYSLVFNVVDLKTAKKTNLTNFFIEKYDMSGDVAADAVDLFVYFATKAQIEVSEDLKAFSQQPRQPREESSRRSSSSSIMKPSPQPRQAEALPEGWIELRLENVRIWLPKGDRSAAMAAKKLLDLHAEGSSSN